MASVKDLPTQKNGLDDKVRPNSWVKVVSDGNVVDISKDSDGWIDAGQKIISHGGKVLPKFEKNPKDTKNQKDQTKKIDEPTENSKDESTTDIEYPVFIVFSQWSLPEIKDELIKYADNADQIGSVRIDFYHNNQTDRTIILMDSSIYRRLSQKSVAEELRGRGFSITPYEIRPHWYPRENETSDFYIHLPNNLSVDKCRVSLQAKIDELVKFRILDSSSVNSISIPMESRESTKHIGRAYIDFKEGTNPESIAHARVIISYSKWSYKNDSVDPDEDGNVKCFYKKASQKKFSQKTDNESDTKKVNREKNATTIRIPTISGNKFDALSDENAQ